MEEFRIKGGVQVPDVHLKYENQIPILSINFTNTVEPSNEVLIAFLDCVEAWTDLRERSLKVVCTGNTTNHEEIIATLTQRISNKNHVEVIHKV